MLRAFITTAAATLALTAATSASAQDARGFGQKGTFIISADRLVPVFAYQNTKTTDSTVNPNTSSSTSTTSISVLPNFNANNTSLFNIPHVGFDYAIIDHLTIGGAIYVAFNPTASTAQSQGGTTVSADSDKYTFFGLAPRVGYVLPLADWIAFWPRGGLSFNMLHTSSPDVTVGNNTNSSSSSTTLWALNLEPVFMISPVQHFGFTLGPVVDIPLTGTTKTDQTRNGTTTTVSRDFSQFHFGITAGLLGWF